MKGRPAESSDPSETPALVQGELTLIGGLNAKLFRLLGAIAATGSITGAARRVGLSYKGAWEIIDRANNLSPEILVDTAVGGRSGGGTKLTPAGAELLKLYSGLEEEHRAFLARVNRELAESPGLKFLHRRLKLQTSARNQLFGRVKNIVSGSLIAEVIVDLKGGNQLVASVTHASVEALGLAPGREVVALIKAPQIVVVRDFGGYRLSARNQLAGRVDRIHRGAVTSDLVMKLDGGDSLAATLTNESLDGLGIAEGDAATAVFKAGAVILGAAA